MSVYARFKRSPDGFRKLVELLESTRPSRRQKMIDVGIAEDEEYTYRALEYVMEFSDVIALPPEELSELCAKARPQIIAYALNGQHKEVIDRFLKCSTRPVALQISDLVDAKVSLRDVQGAQLKLIEDARALERNGILRTKRIPSGP